MLVVAAGAEGGAWPVAVCARETGAEKSIANTQQTHPTRAVKYASNFIGVFTF